MPQIGDTKTIIKEYVRCECENCGEPAEFKRTYLAPNARSNPASSAYGRDDCSWCSDHDELLCAKCNAARVEVAVPDGYGWCSTFQNSPRFQHMFHRWAERDVTTDDLVGAVRELFDRMRDMGFGTTSELALPGEFDHVAKLAGWSSATPV